MLAPLAVEHGEHHAAFEITQAGLADGLLHFAVLLPGVLDDQVAHGLDGLRTLEAADDLPDLVFVDLGGDHGVERLEQALPIPVLRFLGSLVGTLDVGLDGVGNETQDVLVDVFALEHGLTLGVDDGTLLVHHVVVLQHVLTNLVVAGFDGLLCGAHALGHGLGLDRLAFLHALGHDLGHQLGVEQTHQIVFQRQVEAGLAWIALTAGTTAQLVVDSTGLVALGAEHVQAAQLLDLLMLVLDLGLDLVQGARPTLLILFRGVLRRVALGLQLGVGKELDVTAEHDVGTTAGHVGGHGDGSLAAGDGDHGGFLLMLLGVQDLVRDLGHVEQGGDHFGAFHGSGTEQHRLTLGVTLGHVLDDGGQLLLLGAVDEVVLVLADHRLVGLDRQHAQLVGVHELGGLGFGRTGHARELVVHTEVVLQGDGGEGLVLGLDLHAFLGLDGLVQTLVVAAARQDTAGVLVDDEHLALGDDVVLVTQEQFLGLDGVVEVADQGGVGRLIQVVDAEEVLDLGDARVQDADDLLLLVDVVVLVAGELQHQLGELTVPAGHVAFGRAGDDKRGTGLIDEDGIDLIDDGVVVTALHEVGLLPCHVVTQVVEAELVVGAVGDVSVVLLAALRRLLLGDDAADVHAEETVDTAHQLALVAGEVVVDGDHVHALAFESVQIGGQGGDQGLAFTGLHFGDVAPVQGSTAHELHVEVTLAKGALGDLAHGGERLGHDLVQALAVFDFLLELRGLGLQILVGEGGDLVLKSVHGLGHVLQLLELVAFTHSQGFVNNIDHWVLP